MSQLSFRPIAAGDAPLLHGLLADPEVARWLRGAGATGGFSLAECEAFTERKVAHWQAHGFGNFFAFDGDACVGRGILQHQRAAGRSELEIGWTVARDAWGRGLATAIGRHALEQARAAGFARVIAFTTPDNVRSRRVMDKLGMHHERDLIYDGLPHVLYAIEYSA